MSLSLSLSFSLSSSHTFTHSRERVCVCVCEHVIACECVCVCVTQTHNRTHSNTRTLLSSSVDSCPDFFSDYRVFSVVWSPNGKQIASGSGDSTIKIWDSQSGDCESTLTGHRYVTPPPLPATTVLSPTALILQVQCPHTGYLLGHLLGRNSCQWSMSN